jgi:uncharacterized protein YndB with AHSA1/START domain
VSGSCEVRLTRYYGAAPDEVWAALTDRESLARWLGRPGAVDLRRGGAFEVELDASEAVEGRVRSVEPSRLLELDWTAAGEEPSIVRFELNPDADGGTVLVLDHRRIEATIGMRYLTRWGRRLTRLDAMVER